jgi:hypothetical protein
MEDREIRDALERHWAASDANDFAVEHEIYREDAVLHYPQSGERIRGRHDIQESRAVQPSEKRFAVQRIIGVGDLWVTEFVLSYDDVPSYAVSIMEFSDGKVARETQYFGDPFKPGPSRRTWSSRMPERRVAAPRADMRLPARHCCFGWKPAGIGRADTIGQPPSRTCQKRALAPKAIRQPAVKRSGEAAWTRPRPMLLRSSRGVGGS